MRDWISKIAGYAPDIAAAVATGGTSLAATGLRILGRELLGDEDANTTQVRHAVEGADMGEIGVKLQRCNNEFTVEMARIDAQREAAQLADKQHEHETAQETIRSGDNSDNAFVAMTRPGQSWVSLFAAIAYVFVKDSPDVFVLGVLLTLPFAYAGLRQVGKWKTTAALADVAKAGGALPAVMGKAARIGGRGKDR